MRRVSFSLVWTFFRFRRGYLQISNFLSIKVLGNDQSHWKLYEVNVCIATQQRGVQPFG